MSIPDPGILFFPAPAVIIQVLGRVCMNKIKKIPVIMAIMLAAVCCLPVYAETLISDDVILFENFEYDPAAYVMGQNFCYGPGDEETDPQLTPPTGTLESRGNYWIGTRRNFMRNMESYAAIAPGKGVGGGSAVSIASGVTYDGDSQTDIQMFTPSPLDVSSYKYLIVWCDFSNVQLRGSSFSLITSDGVYGGTDERDNEYDPFWYLADGSSSWQELELGSDNVFGTGQDVPIGGMKGYFAFELADFVPRQKIYTTGQSGVTDELPMNSIVGVTLWFDFPNDEAGVYDNVPFYLDNILFTKNLSVQGIPEVVDEPEEISPAPEAPAPADEAAAAAPPTAAPAPAAEAAPAAAPVAAAAPATPAAAAQTGDSAALIALAAVAALGCAVAAAKKR